MTALRMTRPAAHRWWVGLTALGLFGCGSATPPTDESQPTAALGVNDPDWLTSREKLPAPDVDRIEYDAEKRTLSFYDLPGQDRWMVKLPNEATGRTVGPQLRLPEGFDANLALVYYVRPGVKASLPVTVAAIEAGRTTRSSSFVTNR